MRRRSVFVVASAALAGSGLMMSGVAASVAGPVLYNHPRIAAGHASGSSSSTGWAASNWSGYAKTGTYTSATAQWVVPSVAASKSATYSSQWVGIDGFNNSQLIQTGTEADYYNGAAHYNAWWEILPAPETPISAFAVHPGDTMTATITKLATNSWKITINDVTHPGTFSTTQTYKGPGASVEWIEEAPSIGGRVATLAHYSSPDSFDPGTANGANPALTANDGGVMIQKRAQVSTPSLPDTDTDGFNMAYGSTAPAPPTNS